MFLNQPIESLIRHVDAGLVGLDGTEGEVFSRNRALGQSVVEGRLAHVWQPHDPDLEPAGELAEGPSRNPRKSVP